MLTMGACAQAIHMHGLRGYMRLNKTPPVRKRRDVFRSVSKAGQKSNPATNRFIASPFAILHPSAVSHSPLLAAVVVAGAPTVPAAKRPAAGQ